MLSLCTKRRANLDINYRLFSILYQITYLIIQDLTTEIIYKYLFFFVNF